MTIKDARTTYIVLKPTQPDTIKFSLTLELPLREWVMLRNQLASGNDLNEWPATGLREAIGRAVDKATRTYDFTIEEEPKPKPTEPAQLTPKSEATG